MKDYNLRKPFYKEISELQNWIKTELGLDQSVLDIKNYFVGVIDNYISDCPAYSGKLYFIVWGLPEQYDVLIYNREGKLKKVEREC